MTAPKPIPGEGHDFDDGSRLVRFLPELWAAFYEARYCMAREWLDNATRWSSAKEREEGKWTLG